MSKPMDTLLQVRDVAMHFHLKGGAVLKAVDGVSFDVRRGETLGVVGESGCGKSTLGKALLRLFEPTAGSALLDGRDIFGLDRAQLKAERRKMQMIFQDPFSSLNPRRSAASIIEQPLVIHSIGTPKERRQRVDSLMEEVGLDVRYRNRYPHQFSGGQRQRVGIARALALNPELVICDEAVSALDVSIQAQIINLLLDLQKSHGLTYIFIAHDLSVVEFIADRILVMYLGRIVEDAPKSELVEKHYHPYTQALFEASPEMDPDQRGRRCTVMGDLPSPINPPKGCHFHPRCPKAMPQCRESYPERKEIAPGHFTSCHLY
jgi:oligopeptide/dipeptide ABC transporter ATP-binding protein